MVTILCNQGRATKTVEYGFCLQEAVDRMYAEPKTTPTMFYWRKEAVEKDLYACAFLPPHYPVPATLQSVEIRKQYVAFYHWTWVPNCLRPLFTIYQDGSVYRAKH